MKSGVGKFYVSLQLLVEALKLPPDTRIEAIAGMPLGVGTYESVSITVSSPGIIETSEPVATLRPKFRKTAARESTPEYVTFDGWGQDGVIVEVRRMERERLVYGLGVLGGVLWWVYTAPLGGATAWALHAGSFNTRDEAEAWIGRLREYVPQHEFDVNGQCTKCMTFRHESGGEGQECV